MHNLLDQDDVPGFEQGPLDFLQAAFLAGLVDEEQLVFFADDVVNEIDDSLVREHLEDSGRPNETVLLAILEDVVFGKFLHGVLDLYVTWIAYHFPHAG